MGFPDLVLQSEPMVGWEVESMTRDQGLPTLCQNPALLDVASSLVPRTSGDSGLSWAGSVACVDFCGLQFCPLGHLHEVHSSISSGPTWAVSASVLLKTSLVKLASLELFGNTLQSLWGLLHQPHQVFPEKRYYSQYHYLK